MFDDAYSKMMSVQINKNTINAQQFSQILFSLNSASAMVIPEIHLNAADSHLTGFLLITLYEMSFFFTDTIS